MDNEFNVTSTPITTPITIKNLARLTGWNIDEIRKQMKVSLTPDTGDESSCWEGLWD